MKIKVYIFLVFCIIFTSSISVSGSNLLPEPDEPSGPTQGYINQPYTFDTGMSTPRPSDFPCNEKLSYQWCWGDLTRDDFPDSPGPWNDPAFWYGYTDKLYRWADRCIKTHTFTKIGTFNIIVYATRNMGHRGSYASPAHTINIFEVPLPKLEVEGSLNWPKAKIGTTLEGNFTIKNIGDEPLFGHTIPSLDWEIINWPSKGTWTFYPMEGSNINNNAIPSTRGQNQKNIKVTVVAPDISGQKITGYIRIKSTNAAEGYSIRDIPVTLNTVKDKAKIDFTNYFEKSNLRFPILKNLIFKFLNEYEMIK